MPRTPNRFDKETVESHVHVDPETGCWRWKGKLNKAGHAFIIVGGAAWLGHRLAWVLYKGAIPDKAILVKGDCAVAGCVNPEHWRLSTRKEQRQRTIDEGKLPRGLLPWAVKKHRRRKLTPEMVEEIRGSDATNKALAEKFGVAPPTISAVRHGRTKAIPVAQNAQ